MHRGWPGLLNEQIDGWIIRLSGGVTQRANSVLPVRSPRDPEAAIEQVEMVYRQHNLVPTFQLSPVAQPINLDAILATRGYELRSPTLVQAADVSTGLQALSPPGLDVVVHDDPGPEWMHVWWSIDGRGDSEAKKIARCILTSCPALYASIHDSAGPAAVGRLALIDGWGGVYCMAVRDDVRRRGYAKAVLRALLHEAVNRHIQQVWLQVVEQNHAAPFLYEGAGFVTASRYHYRVRC